MSGMPAQSRTRMVGFGLLLASFLVGALSGAAVDRVLSAAEPDTRARAERDRDDGRRSYVIDHVEMAPEQRASIDAILERRSERMRAEYERKLEKRRARRQADEARDTAAAPTSGS